MTAMATDDPYDLQRFVTAQDAGGTYQQVLAELRAGRRVRTIHQALTGTDPDGTRYRLDEPGLLLWVHCGEVASCVDIARRSRLPFSAAELDAFVAEQRASAELIGIDRSDAPTSSASSTVTSSPRVAHRSAASSPIGPAPMTITRFTR